MSIGLPKINVEFKAAAETLIRNAGRGVVALIVRDSAVMRMDVVEMTSKEDVRQMLSLSNDNKKFIEAAFLGYENPPKKVLVAVIGLKDTATGEGGTEAGEGGTETGEGDTAEEALEMLSAYDFDWIAGFPDGDEDDQQAIVDFVIDAREERNAKYKAVVTIDADDKAIVSFDADEIRTGRALGTLTAAQYTSRIAGLLATIPLDRSCTYAVLPEVVSVKRISVAEQETAIQNGKLILINDGDSVRIARGVTSAQMTESEDDKKIKIVEAQDKITSDLRNAFKRNYVGRFANNYDNKCLVIAAIKEYFTQLENSGILQTGSTVGIDIAAQTAYLAEKGIAVSEMTEREIKEAPTGDEVFITASVKILDAMENFTMSIDNGYVATNTGGLM